MWSAIGNRASLSYWREHEKQMPQKPANKSQARYTNTTNHQRLPTCISAEAPLPYISRPRLQPSHGSLPISGFLSPLSPTPMTERRSWRSRPVQFRRYPTSILHYQNAQKLQAAKYHDVDDLAFVSKISCTMQCKLLYKMFIMRATTAFETSKCSSRTRPNIPWKLS